MTPLEAPPVPSRPRSRLRLIVLAVFLVAAAGFAGWALAGQWQVVRHRADELDALPVVGAAALALASLGASLLTWRTALAGLGARLPVRTAARIFFVGQLGKYVPGSVWPVLAQMELGAAAGLSRPQVGTASLLTIGLGVPGALLLGLLAAPALLSSGGGLYALVFLLLPVALALLHPAVLNPLVRRGLALLRRAPLPTRLTGRAIAKVAACSALANVLLGLQAWLLALDLGAHGATVLPLAVGGFTLATVAGLLAIPVPAGAGVREAVLVGALSAVLPVTAALLLAIVSRLVLTAADLSVAGFATVMFRRTARAASHPTGATR